jgi:nitroreductase
VRLDAPGFVDAGRIDFEPALGRLAPHEGRTAHVGDLLHRLARGQAMGDLDDGALGIAVQQQVALGVHHDRAADLVLPVVVMRDATQRAFDAAEHDRHVAPGFLAALRVDDGRAVGPLAADVAGRVGVVAANLAVRRVAVDHRIHVAGGHAEEQVRLAQHLEGVGALPVGLRDDADAKALRLQHAADDRHAEARMVDVGIAGDDDDVAAVPAQGIHLGARRRQELRRAETGRPVLAVAGQRLGGAGEKGDVDGGVHGARTAEGAVWAQPDRLESGGPVAGNRGFYGFLAFSVLSHPRQGLREMHSVPCRLGPNLESIGAEPHGTLTKGAHGQTQGDGLPAGPSSQGA